MKMLDNSIFIGTLEFTMPIRLNNAEQRDYLILRALWELEEPYFESDLKRMICRVQRRDLPAHDEKPKTLTEIFPIHSYNSFELVLGELEEAEWITCDLDLTFEGVTHLSNLNRGRLGITSYTEYSCP